MKLRKYNRVYPDLYRIFRTSSLETQLPRKMDFVSQVAVLDCNWSFSVRELNDLQQPMKSHFS
jgi:hypothetical protein